MANRKTVKQHALKRLKGRVGIKDRTEQLLFAQTALEKGTRVIDLPDGEFKNRMFKKYRSNTRRKCVYIYDGYCCVFRNKKLITVYKLER